MSGQKTFDFDGRLDVLGDIEVERDKRQGSSPWSRIKSAKRIRVLIGDIEFGVSESASAKFQDHVCSSNNPPRIVAQEVLEKWISEL